MRDAEFQTALLRQSAELASLASASRSACKSSSTACARLITRPNRATRSAAGRLSAALGLPIDKSRKACRSPRAGRACRPFGVPRHGLSTGDHSKRRSHSRSDWSARTKASGRPPNKSGSESQIGNPVPALMKRSKAKCAREKRRRLKPRPASFSNPSIRDL